MTVSSLLEPFMDSHPSNASDGSVCYNRSVVPSAQSIRIAVDAMGGDHGPSVVFRAADQICARYPDVVWHFFGVADTCNPHLALFPRLKKRSSLHHTDHVIANDAKPSVALRQGKNSSMYGALASLRARETDVAISAGNTGALMAIARLLLGMLPTIDRPAIAAVIPHMQGRSIMLDLGANAVCTAENLYQFAFIGSAFASALFALKAPRIGLLNIGSEQTKGNDLVQASDSLIRHSEIPLHYHGYIEGDDIARGVTDVIVTDGFSGNVALKTAEGTARMCTHYLKDAFSHSVVGKILGYCCRPWLRRSLQRIDPRRYNGAMLVGLGGLVVKSHGNADIFAYEQALETAITLAKHRVNDRLLDILTGMDAIGIHDVDEDMHHPHHETDIMTSESQINADQDHPSSYKHVARSSESPT